MLAHIGQQILYRRLEKSVAQWLALDPAAHTKLAVLNGQLFLFCCSTPNIRFYIQIDNNECRFVRGDNEQDLPVPNATLEGSMSALLKLLSASTPSAALSDKALSLRGDNAAFEQFISIFKTLDADFEKPLADIVGDVPAHAIGKALRELNSTRKKVNTRIKQHTEEFMLHEAKLTPTTGELERFSSDVFALKQDAERLAAKIQRLTNTINANTTDSK